MELVRKNIAVEVAIAAEGGFQLAERLGLVHQRIHVKHPLVDLLICQGDSFRGIRLTRLD